jgi:transposase-like protein
VIQLGDDRYWLDAAVDLDSNKLLHTKLESVRTNVFAHYFFSDNARNTTSDVVFLVDGATPLQEACSRHGLDFRYERHRNLNCVEHVFREVKRRTLFFSNCFSNAEAETADE